MARDVDIARREERGITRPEPFGSPFRMMERFADEMDQLFDEFGFGRGWMTPKTGRSWFATPTARGDWKWVPDVEVFHRNSELVIRADLPGLTRNDIKVDVSEDRVTIQGERKREHEEEREGVYRSERSYGTFYRDIRLPPGTMSDQAKATFRDGVLEIAMPAPPESARQGRRLEISETKK
jgi:HSP20 family protein